MVYYWQLYSNQKSASKVAKKIREESWIYMTKPVTDAKTYKTRSGKFGIKIQVEV